MKLPITKSGRKYGYIIWNLKNSMEMEKMLHGMDSVPIIFNGFVLGQKSIDRRYHRISLGYKLTRALPLDQTTFILNIENGALEVTTSND